jgi:hypothetical protein
MAVELARSFCFWNSANDISFFILTDLDEPLPKGLGSRVSKITAERGALGKGFSAKLYLDQFAPADQTLFVDADCLCVGPVDFIFDRFAGHAVSVVGGTITSGEWFGDVERTCREADVPALPKFNGGIYYLERGAKSSAVYQRARELMPRYDNLGLVRLRGLPNDELIMAIAMAQEDCWGIPEDGTIMGDFQSTPTVRELDVVMGRCFLENPPAPDPRHKDWHPLTIAHPAIVHFLGHHVSSWLYRGEILRLQLAINYGLAPRLASAIGTAYRMPFQVRDAIRDLLRPVFHASIGPRRIKEGVR